MALSQLSPPSIMANPAHINPTVQSEQQAVLVKVDQQADESVKHTATDTITISSYALKRSSQK